MAEDSFPVNNLLGTAKSREVRRATLAEMRGERPQARDANLALRSRLSAASCFWRAGHIAEARNLFDSLRRNHPNETAEIQKVMDDLEHAYPALAS